MVDNDVPTMNIVIPVDEIPGRIDIFDVYKFLDKYSTEANYFHHLEDDKFTIYNKTGSIRVNVIFKTEN